MFRVVSGLHCHFLDRRISLAECWFRIISDDDYEYTYGTALTHARDRKPGA